MDGLGLLLAILLGGVALYLVLRGITRLGVQRLRFDISATPTVVGAVHSAPCNLGGGIGEGIAKLRGNGVLGLTPTELRFVLDVPRRELAIPRAAITRVSVEPVLQLAGRTVSARHPWLVVWWIDERGDGAMVGLLVPEPDRWRAELLGEPGGLLEAGSDDGRDQEPGS